MLYSHIYQMNSPSSSSSSYSSSSSSSSSSSFSPLSRPTLILPQQLPSLRSIKDNNNNNNIILLLMYLALNCYTSVWINVIYSPSTMAASNVADFSVLPELPVDVDLPGLPFPIFRDRNNYVLLHDAHCKVYICRIYLGSQLFFVHWRWFNKSLFFLTLDVK